MRRVCVSTQQLQRQVRYNAIIVFTRWCHCRTHWPWCHRLLLQLRRCAMALMLFTFSELLVSWILHVLIQCTVTGSRLQTLIRPTLDCRVVNVILKARLLLRVCRSVDPCRPACCITDSTLIDGVQTFARQALLSFISINNLTSYWRAKSDWSQIITLFCWKNLEDALVPCPGSGFRPVSHLQFSNFIARFCRATCTL